MPTSPYPHLSPELQALSGDALRLWGDADERRRALEAILHAWEADSPDVRTAVARVDTAIAVGLHALGLPRAEIKGVRLEATPVRWAGRKDPDCTLNLSMGAIRDYLLRKRLPDALFRTWVHESLHARQAFAPDYRIEYARFPGYEEGVVEGLARNLLRERAGLSLIGGTFEYPVTAYRTLAVAFEVDVDQLWRGLWQARPGAVRAALPGMVDDLYRQHTGTRLTAGESTRLRGLADVMLGFARTGQRPDMALLTRTWRLALR